MSDINSNSFDKPKINEALEYENFEIVQKFSEEHNLYSGDAQNYFKEVKRFLILCSLSKEPLAPSREIDKIWHTFILFTKDYRFFCLTYLGQFIDHVPQVGESTTKEDYLKKTIVMYIEKFRYINNDVWQVNLRELVPHYFDDRYNDDDDYTPDTYSDCEAVRRSCAFTGDCFDCTDSGQKCVGDNPNDL